MDTSIPRLQADLELGHHKDNQWCTCSPEYAHYTKPDPGCSWDMISELLEDLLPEAELAIKHTKAPKRVSSQTCPLGKERIRDEWVMYDAWRAENDPSYEAEGPFILCPTCSGWHKPVEETTCPECDGHGGAIMEYQDDLNIAHREWIPCHGCGEKGTIEEA